MAEVFSVRPAGPSVLFSGLFFVAASRLNSPRFQFCLYAAVKIAVKEIPQPHLFACNSFGSYKPPSKIADELISQL